MKSSYNHLVIVFVVFVLVTGWLASKDPKKVGKFLEDLQDPVFVSLSLITAGFIAWIFATPIPDTEQGKKDLQKKKTAVLAALAALAISYLGHLDMIFAAFGLIYILVYLTRVEV